ncbi:hypothetical protein Ancab_022907 [Ancistrocladus abbreviatus]
MEAPEFGYFSPEKRLSDATTTGDNFIVEDLLDFSNDDGIITDGTFDSVTDRNSTESSTITIVDCFNSSFSAGNDPHFTSGNGDIGCRSSSAADTKFTGDLCVPYDDVAELEWLSNFFEESFSSEDLQKLQLISGISGIKTRPNGRSEAREPQPDPARNATSANSSNAIINNSPTFSPEMPVPGKARSKRSRAAPCNWASRLLVLSPTTNQPQSHTQTTSSTESDMASAVDPKPVTKPTPKKKGGGRGGSSDVAGASGEGRKCLHCATDKTPQWRTGPMGPKTLCNACGVRYKSGRLVPEYRPAASPTFVLTKHSNSHRKVMELRRQKELMRQQQLEQQHEQQQFTHANLMFDGLNHDDYLIHQPIGPDFRQLI